MITQFRTTTAIPLEAFTILGINVKFTATAIGRFGTGLKYAVAVILRHGGRFRLFVEGVEYEFYLGKLTFRGTDFKQIRMRKRNGLGKWLSSKALPFTTEFGKDWKLWQAYRELESNTRDEGGETWSFLEEEVEGQHFLPREDYRPPARGTTIQIECPGFAEAIKKDEVFLDRGNRKLLHSCPAFDIYEGDSRHIYYQGIRVYELRYPARFTYDFKPGYVTLTEDRTAANAFMLFYYIAKEAMDFSDEDLLRKIMAKGDAPCMETHDLNFDTDRQARQAFRTVAHSLWTGGSLGKSGGSWRAVSVSRSSATADISVTLSRGTWELLLKAVERGRHYDPGWSDESEEAYQKLSGKLAPGDGIPF